MVDAAFPLAHHVTPGAGPTIVFLPGYASDMGGSKAVAIEAWARAAGRGFVRFDYRGCGESAGDFEAFTLADWRDDVLAVIDRLTAGPVVLVGSSMGGWLMLLAALARPDRVSALVGIAAAPDFTEWGFSVEQRDTMARDGRLVEPSPYGPDPTVTTHAFWRAGQAFLLLDGVIDFDGPVRLLHGQRDPDVPWGHALTLAERLRSADVQTILVKDGDHRLSRDADIALIVATIEALP